MRRYIDIIEEAVKYQLEESRRTYDGPPLESGGTSIKGKGENVPAPAVKWLFEKGYITADMKVLDYGAGKYGRNANYLREQGCEVYGFDPYNGSDANGWEGVSNKKPTEKFDVGFSSFVLNVVPEYIEDEIITDLRRMVGTAFHVTRNMDIFTTVKNALNRGDSTVVNFFKEEYATDPSILEKYENGGLTEDDILDFCYFGVKTSRGFQRIPVLEDKGFRLIRKTMAFKIYTK